MSPSVSSRLRIVAAALLFSTGGAAIKASAFTAWQVASFRSGIAAVAVWLIVPAARRGWSWRTLLVAIAYAATLTLFVLANRLTTSANTIFLQSTAPLYLLLLGPLLLHERVTGRDVAVMGAVVLGLALFFVEPETASRTAPDPVRGNVLAVLSGVSWALTVLGLRWTARHAGPDDGGATAAVVLGNLIAFGAALPLALPVTASTPASWAGILYLGVFQIGLAYVFLSAAMKHVPALEASMLLLLEPALNPVFSWLVHGERPGALAIGGGALILGATTLKSAWDARAPVAVRD